MEKFISFISSQDFSLYYGAIGLFIVIAFLITYLVMDGIYNSFQVLIGYPPGFRWVITGVFFFLTIFPLGHTYITEKYRLTAPVWNTEIQVVHDNSEQLSTLSDAVNELEKGINNTEDLTIGQLQSVLKKSLKLYKQTKDISKQQQKDILNLKNEIKGAKKKVIEAKRLVADIKSMTDSQMQSIKLLITEDAKVESDKAFLNGIVLSFPIGVFASLIGSILLRRFFTRNSYK